MNQLKKAAVLSYINIGFTNIIGLVLTPFIIRTLGTSDYGLYSLIGSLVAYLALMDLGLNSSVVRFISKYRAENNLQEEQQFLGTTMLVYGLISVLLLVIGIVLYFNLDLIFDKSLSVSQLEDAKIMFLILLFNIVITLPGGTFSAICTAYQEFVFPRLLQIIRYILRTITVFAVLTYGGKAISLVIIDTVFSLVFILITFYFCVSKLKVKFKLDQSYKTKMHEIFSYSIWIFITVMVFSFQWNAGQLILGMNLNTSVVAIFAIGLMLGSYLGSFAGVVNTLLLPKAATDLANNSSPEAITHTMIRVGRMNVFISFVIITGFLLVGKEFIILWVGTSYISAWNIASIIMLVTVIALSQSFGSSILEIKNKIKYRSIFALCSMCIAVTFSFFLAVDYGIYGVLIPITVSMLINTIFNNILFVIHFQFRLIYFYKKTFLYQTIFTLSFVIIGYFIKKIVTINSWSSFIVIGTGFILVYVLFYYLLLFSKEEKSFFLIKKNL